MSVKAVRIDLPVDLHEYLTVVLKRYSGAGIDPEEGMALFHLWDFVTKRATVIELVTVPSAAPQPPSEPTIVNGVQVPKPPMDDDELGDR